MNSKTNHPPPSINVVCKFASIGDSLLEQALLLLLFQYAATLSRRRGLIYFCKVDNSRISKIFSGTDFFSIIYVRYCHEKWEN